MKHQILTLAIAIVTIGATAQEKVRVHNGTESYVTEIEYLTFDDADGEAISVSDLQTENATLEGQISTLTTANTNLEGQVSALTTENSELVNDTIRLYGEVEALNSQIAGKNTQIAGLETDTTNLNIEIKKLKDWITKQHAYVDLGLPSGTLWATCNIGATNPEDYGDYFAWGETTTKTTYNWSTYKYMDHTYDSWKGCTKYTFADNQTSGVWYKNGEFIGDNLTELEDKDDVAVQQWGGNWCMPTDDQLKELKNNCYWVWTTKYNGKSVNGYIVYKKKSEGEYRVANDPHIFLPAAGYRGGGGLYDAGSGGYWSRSLYTGGSDGAYYLYFDSSYVGWNGYYRSRGLSVRAVCPGAQK